MTIATLQKALEIKAKIAKVKAEIEKTNDNLDGVGFVFPEWKQDFEDKLNRQKQELRELEREFAEL